MLGAGTAFAVQRVRLDKFGYNVAAYACEAATDTALVRVLLGGHAHLDLVSALIVLAVVACVDQVMSSLVLLMIRLHNGPMTRRAIAHVLVPALVVTAVSATVAVGVLLLNAAGPLGDVVLAAATGAGLVLYRTYLGMRRRHAALELVHDFVTGSAGADSFAAAARELLPRIRTLLRAGSVEMLVLPSAAEDSTSQSSAPDGTASDGSAPDGSAPDGTDGSSSTPTPASGPRPRRSDGVTGRCCAPCTTVNRCSHRAPAKTARSSDGCASTGSATPWWCRFRPPVA